MVFAKGIEHSLRKMLISAGIKYSGSEVASFIACSPTLARGGRIDVAKYADLGFSNPSAFRL